MTLHPEEQLNITIGEGSFTTLLYLEGYGPRELEVRVGYERGRLRDGYRIVVLADHEVMHPKDFHLDASTRWSDGKLGSKSSPKTINDILLARGNNIDEAKRKVAKFFSLKLANRPSKILPNLRHVDGMIYPDAEALGPGMRSGIPAFKLVEEKRFRIYLEVGKN